MRLRKSGIDLTDLSGTRKTLAKKGIIKTYVLPSSYAPDGTPIIEMPQTGCWSIAATDTPIIVKVGNISIRL